jgi:FlaG/FlaF family flagellin (archaellin)
MRLRFLKFLKNLQRNDEAITPVAGVILLLALSLILASIVLNFGMGAADIKKPPDLYFTQVEARPSGWISATAVGSSTINAGDLKILVDDQRFIPSSINFLIDDQPYSTSNSHITGGSKIALKVAESYQIAQNVRVTIADIPTGSLLSDVEVKVRGE